jgi:hypothetical protein
MDPVHDDHGKPHDQCVEYVEEVLMDHDVPGSTLRILDYADNRSDEDQDADDIKRDHVLLPWCSVAAGSRLFAEARMKDGGCNDEEAEDDNLGDETGDNDVVAHVAIVGAVCGGKKASTCAVVLALVRLYLNYSRGTLTRRLHQKREHIARDKKLREPSAPDEERALTIDHEYDSAQLHVDRGGEEGGRNEQKYALHDVWAQRVWSRVLLCGQDTSDVPNRFDWG